MLLVDMLGTFSHSGEVERTQLALYGDYLRLEVHTHVCL